LPKHRAIILFALLVSSIAAQEPERTRAITPPLTPLPAEADSRNVTRFSFIVYGDSRGRQDGVALQYEHSLVVNSMIAEIKRLHGTQYPVGFVLQSGDAVVNGLDAHQWNTSFIPLRREFNFSWFERGFFGSPAWFRTRVNSFKSACRHGSSQ
jgi:hypothetical protein